MIWLSVVCLAAEIGCLVAGCVLLAQVFRHRRRGRDDEEQVRRFFRIELCFGGFMVFDLLGGIFGIWSGGGQWLTCLIGIGAMEDYRRALKSRLNKEKQGMAGEEGG